jgi:hypothetical protein
VIVTNEGKLGIGTIPPAASSVELIVTDGGTPAAPGSPLRIVDGTQGEGKVLTSNAQGDASWQDLPSVFNLGETYGLQGIPEQTIHEHENNNTMYGVGFSFTANAAGFYAFEVRWWGRFNESTERTTLLHCRLLRNGSQVDEYETYVTLNGTDAGHFCTCFSLYSQANAGQIFTMVVRPTFYMFTENDPATPWTQAKVNVLRLN